MEHLKYILFSIIVILSSCHCEHCNDNLSAENNKIPYTDSLLICFQNDTLGKVYDTVFVEKGKISKMPYACNGGHDSDAELCSGLSIISYSNKFYLDIYQTPNDQLFTNDIFYGIIYSSNYLSYNYTIKNVDYIYNQKKINAVLRHYEIDSSNLKYHINSDSTFTYNDYYYTIDNEIKLLQYSTLSKNGTKRIWKLKE
jgi:hypothetical protein